MEKLRPFTVQMPKSGQVTSTSDANEVPTATAAMQIPFEKGFSQMDWLRLTNSKTDLSGLKGKRPRKDISMEEVRQHKTREDAWMVLHGKVYHVTPYLKFHPGGADIMVSVAGKDATAVFMKYHPWVNTDALLQKCLVGWIAPPAEKA
eukprot:gene12584-15808_t